MLVLTRKCSEVVVVGGGDGVKPMVTVTVLGISDGKVRLGFEAPTDVSIHRLEVWERIQAGPKVVLKPASMPGIGPPHSHDPWS